jgi:predicted negative regulator of RcsB-dependent stress response
VRTSERHQLKQDRFAETTKETISWAVENRNALVGGITAVVIVVGILLGSMWYLDYRNELANTALGKAMDTYSAQLRPAGTPASPEALSFESAEQRSRAAQSQFQEIAHRYGHTKAGHVARYMAALTAVDLGDTKTAEDELKHVADSASQNLSSQAKLVLAQLYHNTNRDQEAVGLYKDLVQHPSDLVSKSTVQLDLGAVYEAMNQPADASKQYVEIIKTDQQSPAAQVAQQRLMALKQ